MKEETLPQIRIAADTLVGQVRQHNEDRISFCADLAAGQWQDTGVASGKLSSEGSLLCVADGLGGHEAGEVAATLATESVVRYPFSTKAPKNPSHQLIEAIMMAHERIVAQQQQNPKQRGMGTTLVLAWLVGQQLHVGWSGDSRCYLYHPRLTATSDRVRHLRQQVFAIGGMVLVSHDHTLVQEWVDRGNITYEQSFDHPENNVINQCLGMEYDPPEPEAVSLAVRPGDRIMLCSDGVNGMLRDQEIATIMADAADAADCVSMLCESAEQAGGHDNISVIVMDILPPKSEKQSG